MAGKPWKILKIVTKYYPGAFPELATPSGSEKHHQEDI
jgi:hypothetical protein